MKKLVKILVPFLVVSSAVLSGCKKKEVEDTRIQLDFGDVHTFETTEITIEKLNELVQAKENFLFVVSTNTCGCWNEFRPNLERYIVDNKLICYRVTYDQIKDVASAYELYLLSSSTTTFAIFENGKVKTTLCSSEDSKIMYDEKKFAQYMNETVRLPGCYFITKSDYSSIKESGENATIYFERTKCGDCGALNPGLLRSYVKSHPNMKKLYVVDVQPYWRSSSADDYTSTYLATKDELGLSAVDKDGNPNNPYGFGAGVFPFFSYIENCTYASGAVVYNDSVDSNLVVAESYYTTERVANLQYTNTIVKGKQLTDDDVSRGSYNGHDYVIWNHDSADKVYEGILNSFLDYALPKTTFEF